MGCCQNENREKEINYQNEQKQNILSSKSNEEIENFEIKIDENIIGLNSTEKKKEENKEKKNNEEKEEEKNAENEEEKLTNNKNSIDKDVLKIELYPENLPIDKLEKKSINNILSKETLALSLDENKDLAFLGSNVPLLDGFILLMLNIIL